MIQEKEKQVSKKDIFGNKVREKVSIISGIKMESPIERIKLSQTAKDQLLKLKNVSPV